MEGRDRSISSLKEITRLKESENHWRSSLIFKTTTAYLLWVHRWLGEQYLAVVRFDVQLVERVAPDGLHIVPVTHDAVLHRIGQLEIAPQFAGFIADHDVLRKDWKIDVRRWTGSI